MSLRTDDATVGAYVRQLEKIEQEVQREEFAALPFASGEIVPIETSNEPHIREVTYRQVTRVGRFRLMRGYSTNIPMINNLSKEFTQRVHKWAAGYWVSDDDIEATVETGWPIERENVEGTQEASEQEINDLIAWGDKKLGMPGFLNHPDILWSYSPGKLDASSTPKECLAILNDAVNSVVKLTLQVEKPDTLLLPLDQFHYLSNTQFTDLSSTTILEQFMKTNAYIKNIQPLNELSGAGPDGSDLMMVYTRDKKKVKARVMQPLTWKNLERKGLGFERIAVFKFGGVVFYRPLSAHAIAGI